MEKACLNCGKIMKWPGYDGINHWSLDRFMSDRKYCSRKCTAMGWRKIEKGRAPDYLDKRCENCNGLVKASKHSNPKDREKRNKNKRFCGMQCANEFRRRAADAKSIDLFIYSPRPAHARG
jgi:hypothetical protein